MRYSLWLPVLMSILLSAAPGSFDIRQAYAEIPLEYLPLTRDYVKGKTDNSETRDEILTYHNRGREFISLRVKDNAIEGQLQLYNSASDYYIAVEHTACKRTCENEFVILKKESSGYTNVTNSVLKDFDMNLGSIRGVIKKEFKEAYGTNDMYKESGYDEDATLKEHIYWHIDDQTGVIYLKESSLPHIIATYKWNEKKATFSKQ